MKQKIKRFEFFDEIYRFQWLLVIGGTTQEAVDYFSKKVGEKTWDCGSHSDAHFAAHRPHKCGVIWFKTNEYLGPFVAHECFHATMYLFETLTMKGPTEETEEVFAYYLQWLVKKINQFTLSKR